MIYARGIHCFTWNVGSSQENELPVQLSGLTLLKTWSTENFLFLLLAHEKCLIFFWWRIKHQKEEVTAKELDTGKQSKIETSPCHLTAILGAFQKKKQQQELSQIVLFRVTISSRIEIYNSRDLSLCWFEESSGFQQKNHGIRSELKSGPHKTLTKLFCWRFRPRALTEDSQPWNQSQAQNWHPGHCPTFSTGFHQKPPPLRQGPHLCNHSQGQN